MKTNKSAPKYSDAKSIVKSGFRRVSKQELKALGYSTKSALYTRADVKHPSKFLTRADIAKVQKPAQENDLRKSYGFSQIKRERITGGVRKGKKLFRHTHTIYSDYAKPVSLELAYTLTENFLEYLDKKYHPTWRNQIGVIYIGNDDEFSIQPRLWRDRKTLILGRLKEIAKRYRKSGKFQLNFIIGWIEQSR